MSLTRRHNRSAGDRELAKDVLNRASGPRATSQIVVLPIVLLLSISAFTTAPLADAETNAHWLTAVVVAGVIAWAWFTSIGWCIRLTLKRVGPRAVALAMLYMSTEVLRTMSTHRIAMDFGPEHANSWLFYTVAGSGFGLVLFTLVSVLANDVTVYRTTWRELAYRRSTVESLISSTEAQLNSARNALLETIRSSVQRAIDDAFSNASGRSAGHVVDGMFAVSEHVVRPLAHELYNQPKPAEIRAILAEPPRLPMRRLLAAATTAEAVRPGILVAFYVILGGPTVLFLSTGSSSLMLYLLGFGVLWAAMSAVRWMSRVLSDLRSVAVRVGILMVGYLTVGVSVGLVYAYGEMGLGASSREGVLIAAALTGVMTGGVLSTTAGIRIARSEVLGDLREATVALNWHQVQLQSRLWMEQRAIARMLHSELQGALVAGSLKYRRDIDRGVPSETALADLQQLVSQAVQRVLHEDERMPAADALDSLLAQWDGAIDIQMEVAPETVEAVQSDPVACAVLVELLQNAFTNSVKHGQSTAVDVSVLRVASNVIEIRCVDNGQPVAETPRAGLGMRQLEAITLSYRLSNRADGTGAELLARIPLNTERTAF